MTNDFHFELVSPECLLISDRVKAIILPSACGKMTVMANHAPVLLVIKPGLLNIEFSSGKSVRYMVFKGFANVIENRCTVLTESPVLFEDVAVSTLDQRIELAQRELDDADHNQHRLQIEQFLMDLIHLRNTILSG
ncbi:ATP synthase epsilon chain [Liberibacter crescens BT-1]|uniref:ATP synthase epsilon chain n=1 Tax=Liberibacter crescens (strain BT-1) TaxID=1215343 RepID=L0EWY8_LIBCB|nr:F0F1 ATP synthase subunit epsilon [Liberibacter crescens]AGA65168.1 ATP synthase epsilon chain [Liberibacter crescens BT-1]AMC13126.1 ATP synthase F0F1 subunit epsilon [Liberibacter crescens]